MKFNNHKHIKYIILLILWGILGIKSFTTKSMYIMAFFIFNLSVLTYAIVKNKNKGLYIIRLILSNMVLVSCPIVSRIGVDIVEKYNFKLGSLPKGYINKIIFDIDTYKNFNVENPISVIALVATICFLFKLFLIKNNDKKYEKSSDYGSHGTSRFQTSAEMKRNYFKGNGKKEEDKKEDRKGWFIGSFKENESYKINHQGLYHTVKNIDDLNMQTVVIGSPGSKKTTGFILPNVFNIANSYSQEEKPDIIITDPKAEVYTYTAEDLKKCGYEVRVFDFIDLKYGDTLNPLEFIEDDKTLMEIAKGYINAMSDGDDKQQFWNNQEAQLLAGLMGYVIKNEDIKTFNKVLKLLTSENISNYNKCKKFIENSNLEGAARQFLENYRVLAENDETKANILGGLAEKLNLFSIKNIDNLTNNTSIDLTRLGKNKKNGEKPIAIFMFISVDDTTFSPIVNMFTSIIFKQLYKTAKGKALERKVYFLIDEMANIGKISNIKNMLGTMRGLGIYPMMVWQSLSQMKERYGENGAEDIISMCDNFIFLGSNDKKSTNYVSDLLGCTTIKIDGTSETEKTTTVINVSTGKSENKSYHQRQLLFSDEVRSMNNKKLIFIQRSKQPCIIYKTQYRYWESLICEKSYISDLKEIEILKEETKDVEKVNTITHKNVEQEENFYEKKINDNNEIEEQLNNSENIDNCEIDEAILNYMLNDND